MDTWMNKWVNWFINNVTCKLFSSNKRNENNIECLQLHPVFKPFFYSNIFTVQDIIVLIAIYHTRVKRERSLLGRISYKRRK